MLCTYVIWTILVNVLFKIKTIKIKIINFKIYYIHVCMCTQTHAWTDMYILNLFSSFWVMYMYIMMHTCTEGTCVIRQDFVIYLYIHIHYIPKVHHILFIFCSYFVHVFKNMNVLLGVSTKKSPILNSIQHKINNINFLHFWFFFCILKQKKKDKISGNLRYFFL